MWWWDSNTEHVDDLLEQEDMILIKHRENRNNHQWIPCFRPYLLHDLTQRSSKQNSLVFLCVGQKINLILCNDNICLKHWEEKINII